MKVAQKLPKIEFHLYGNPDTIYKKKIKKLKNIFFKGYVNYSKLVVLINNYNVLIPCNHLKTLSYAALVQQSK